MSAQAISCDNLQCWAKLIGMTRKETKGEFLLEKKTKWSLLRFLIVERKKLVFSVRITGAELKYFLSSDSIEER